MTAVQYWALGLMGACCCAWAQERVLWPSHDFVVSDHPSSRSTIDSDRRIFVKTGPGYPWPGITVAFRKGTIDLSDYCYLRVALSNTMDRAQPILLSVKNRAQQGSSPGGRVTIPANRAAELKVTLHNMPWVLDQPLELVGMRGYPSVSGGGTFDIRKTFSFHIFNESDRPRSFVVSGIYAGKGKILRKGLPAKTFLPFVDRYGQFMHDDWPGKIHNDAELTASRDAERAWLAKYGAGPIADTDQYGGWTAGPRQKATGFFRTEKVNGRWWLVDPEGCLFFSHGIDCARLRESTAVTYREPYFSWLPPEKDDPYSRFYGTGHYAAHGFYKDKKRYRTFDFAGANQLRKYGKNWRGEGMRLAHRRIRAWGMNTIANWSHPQIYGMRQTPYTVTFSTQGRSILGSTGWWGKLRDPFSPEFERNLRESVAGQVKQGTDKDPWCIGYFVDNELSWGHNDHELAVWVLRSPADQPAKIAFRDYLQKKYNGIEELNRKWETSHAGWRAFLSCTNQPNVKRCKKDLQILHRMVLEKYFRTVRDAIREKAPNRLYLGCRIAWGSESVYIASAKYCDVVSVNTYRRFPDKDLPQGAEDKPMINGEFHFGALDRGMFHTGLVGTKDQRERAACYEAFLTACLKHPRYVGTHWFQWRDQALTGRSDGENYQIGFLTVTDTPYPEMVEAARRVGEGMYQTRYGK